MMLHRLALATATAAVAVSMTAATASADTCLGEPCPYSATATIGEQGGGTLRFPQAIAVGQDGLVYVGDQSSRIVQVFTREGAFVRQFGTPGSKPGELSAVSSITLDPVGRVVLTDGGSNHVVFFTPDGRLYRALGGSGSNPGQFRFGAGGGNDQPAGGGIHYYKGVIYVSDSGNDRVQRMNLDGGAFEVFIAPGQLAHPRAIAARGNQVVVADDQNHRLAVFGSDGTFNRSVGLGKGAGPGQLSFPFGVAMDTRSRIFVADDMNQRVVRFDGAPNFTYRARWGSYGTAPGNLAYPRALATDDEGLVYVTNTGNDRIDVFTNTGRLVRSFGRSGRAPGQFNTPSGSGVDASGIRAVTDTINGRVQLFNPDGSLATIWGSPNPGPTILRRPIDVTFDSAGNGYVLDQRRAQIIGFDRATAQPTVTLASPGSGPGQLLSPSAIARSGDGTLWVADTGNSRVVAFGPAGEVRGGFSMPETPRGIAVAPDGSKVFVSTTRNRVIVYDAAGTQLDRFGYGPGNKLGQLNSPADLTLDAAGTVWVADRGNSRVAHFAADGTRLGTFGSRGSDAGGQFSAPSDVAVDCRGVLTVSDTRNNVVRAFTLNTVPAGSACQALPAPGQPPALQYPTLPPPDGPQITASALRTTGLVTRGIAVRAGCDTACTLTATATLTQAAAPAKKKRGKKLKPLSLTLKRVTAGVEAGKTTLLRFSLSRTDRRRMEKALGTRKSVIAAVTITAETAGSEPTTADVRIDGRR
ncbi:MAG: hypothetical protein V9E83_12305 [Baekduia sp.]